LYHLDRPQIRESCLPDNPQIISQRGADTVNKNYPKLYQRGQIEIDSDLKNITRPASNCPTQKYDPRQSNCGCETQGLPGGGGVVAGCEGTLAGGRCGDSEDLTDLVICKFPVENTRLSNPGSNIRGSSILILICLLVITIVHVYVDQQLIQWIHPNFQCGANLVF
jgi:hypothetical protein